MALLAAGLLLTTAALIPPRPYRDLNKNGRRDVYEDSRKPVEARVEDLLAQMTPAGKAGTMFITGARVNGGNWTEVSTAAPIWQMDFSPRSGGVVEVRNQGQTMLFPRAVLEGIPLKGDSTEISQKLTMAVSYLTLSGQPLDPARLEQGSDFLAKVQVGNLSERMLDNLALTQVFPSGWEIRNIRLDNAEQKGDMPDYQDIRDDRVYTFYHLAPAGADGNTRTFYVYLTAAYPGRYYLPAVSTEAMYDHSIQARRKGRWVDVLPEGGR